MMTTHRICSLIASVVLALLASLLPLTQLTQRASAQGPGDTVTVFDDALAEGFQDWSWTTVDLAATDLASTGSTSIRVTFDADGGVQLGNPLHLDIPQFGELVFDVNAGANSELYLSSALLDTGYGAGPGVEFEVPADGQWHTVRLDLADLGGTSRIGGLWWQESRGVARSPIWIDEVRFVAGDVPPAVDGPTLTVDLGERSLVRTTTDPHTGIASDQITTFPHPISEGIYGMNFTSNSLREELDVPVSRWGGNSTERYNFETNSWNTGQDWVFANVSEQADTHIAFEQDNQADGAVSIVTVPAMGWVSAGTDPACSYPVDIFGPQNTEYTVENAEISLPCGDGMQGDQQLESTDPTRTSIAVDETFAAALVQDYVASTGSASSGGVEIYAIGNEPGLWHSTHRDIRPEPIGRDEIFERNARYAAAIKGADPSAEVAGPVVFGGYTFFVSSDEILSGETVDTVPNFSTAYLDAMSTASAQAGTRLLDHFAVNFYDDRVFQGGSDEMRLASTRSLWDVDYAPADWWVTRDWARQGMAIIPRLQSAIESSYPGTELAITEYNFGGSTTVVGALTQIDALGIFGREGLDTATIWDPFLSWVGLTEQEHSQRPLMHAFRMYRNYDGNGGRFGDEALFAESTDEPTVSVYAARRTDDGALTIIINNKSALMQTVPLNIDVRGDAQVYRYSGAAIGGIVQLDDVTVDGDVTLELPGRSATLLVIGDTAPPTDPPVDPPTSGPTRTCRGQVATIVGTSADDMLIGTDGDDVIWAGGGNDVIDAGDGDDLVCAGAGDDDVDGGPGADVLYGNRGNDTIDGGDGDDRMHGSADNDQLDGGSGDDDLRGNKGDDVLIGAADNDVLGGGSGDDELRGDDGDDVLKGHRGADALFGGPGDDLLKGGDGVDVCDAGPGLNDRSSRCES